MFHTNQTYNMLTLDEVDKVPFSKEIADLIQYIKWDEQIWSSFGLPAFNSKFSISKGQLYLEENEFGKPQVEKSEFTGEVGIATVIINPNNCGQVFLLTFKAIFFKGILSEVNFLASKVSEYSAYENGYKNFQEKVAKRQRILTSPWFRFLYKPYYMLVKLVGTTILVPLSLLIQGVVWVLESLLFLKV